MATQETIEKANSWVEKEYDDLRYSKCQCKDFVFTFRELKEMAKKAFIAGHETKAAEPLPPIVQGLIDGQKKINDQLREVAMWRTDEPLKNKKLELLCVLFDEDEYRTLKKNEWDDGYNRFIVTGTWNGAYFRGEIEHDSGDPFPKVVAWRPMEEPNLGAPFYTKCIGECRD